MEPDLQGMRAFVAAAEELHFGQAAERLSLTQQALSKRIRRLENALVTPLFTRTTRRVELTAAGRRFLPLARDAVAAYDLAVTAMRENPAEPLRVDVFAERFTPLRILRETAERVPGLNVEPSMRQGLANALPAVWNGELDAAFGRVHPSALGPLRDERRRSSPDGWPDELAYRPVHLVPLDAFAFTGHALADRKTLPIAEIRRWGIAMPHPGGAREWHDYLVRLSEELRVPVRYGEVAIGVRDSAAQLRRETHAVALGERGMDLPRDPGLRQIPLIDPVPLHLWSVVWRRGNRDPRLVRLLQALPRPEAGPGVGTWLPASDRAVLDAWLRARDAPPG
ncbi:LysR family transcriptional regulator [Actinomadura sp. SCN-SB]|uniref:LysR family transcriptional regulator n=1 Tax=Actinomadura sp. SCN-SB TaxID=3373092 RepID=UPI0037522456